MNETELKKLFKSSIKNRHIQNNHHLPIHISDYQSHQIKIKEEAYFGNFDFVIVIVHKNNENQRDIDNTYSGTARKDIFFQDQGRDDEVYQNIRMRTHQFIQIAKQEKCSIKNLTFIPVEVKSDSDVLDNRLPNQILNAILTFGRSFLVLDQKHISKNLHLLKLLPTTIIGYTGKDDFFEVLSVFDRFVMNGIFSIPKRSFNKLLLDNKVTNKFSDIDKIYKSLVTLERINQKLAFNYLFRFGTNVLDENFLLQEEIKFLNKFCEFFKIPTENSYKKEIIELIKNSENRLITDFL
ncbi:MAG TPA: hypothetical protein VK250_01290 [Nitrososphaeraceae archaeon]|nr:hypothetical protein [Nitrososphaeraceae archaeon]